MKIGIITIMDDTNFGNRLQNYAVCRYFRDYLNCDVKTLAAVKEDRFANRHYNVWIKNEIVKQLSVIPDFAEKRFGAKTLRWANFKQWSRKIPVTYFYNAEGLPESINDEYDVFFVGSDQVFNCNFPAFKEYDYFLKFADNRKKASLSASFGFDSVPDEKKALFAHELKKFRFLSVREKAGKEIIQKLTGREVPVLIDPVMRLSAQEWSRVMKKPRVDTDCRYILKYYLGEKQDDRIDAWAAANGYRVYDILDRSNSKLYSSGPGEFLSLIKNASLVCSDSFHCIVFSIIFKIPFIVYSRRGESDYMTSRLDTLLEKFSLESRWSDRLNEEDYLNCSFSETDQILKKEQEQFDQYVNNVLKAAQNTDDICELADHSSCTGCGACASVCPCNAIEMRNDQNDFPYPEMINPEKCIHCGLCTKVCPVIHSENKPEHVPDAYAVISKDEEIRSESSSGGVFSEIARYVLEQGGIVYGTAYDSDFTVRHRAVETMDDLKTLRGAKYSQSDLGDTFKQVKKELSAKRMVLFSGTPCQVAGLKSYLAKDYANLICIDFVCHGIPSPMVWKEYVRYRAEQDHTGVLPEAINLRSKSTGWSRYRYSNEFIYEDHTWSSLSGENGFMSLFVGDSINRESCASCKFKGYSRISDFTIGDFWGIWDILPEMDDDKGTSVVLIHSEKGRQIFETIGSRITYKAVSLKEASLQNRSMIESSEMRKNRSQKLEQIRISGYRE